jgi:hypothetical protein
LASFADSYALEAVAPDVVCGGVLRPCWPEPMARSRPGWRRCSPICAARNPRSALNWLGRSHGAALLADLAAGTLAASHEALDADPRRRAAGFLRHMLTAADVLAPRDEELARTGHWLDDILHTVEPDTARRQLRSYATWQVMRRLRASAARAARPRSYTGHARRNIRVAAEFLAWLHAHGRALSACTQADVDAWLTTGGPAAAQARDFLTWAATHGHCPALTIPESTSNAGPTTSPDQRWTQAARLLHDNTLGPTDRAAGCLLLLYGQQLSRIAAMTTNQVTTRDGAVHIRLGGHDVPVPEPLGELLTELIRNGRAYTGTGSPTTSPWLFPGGLRQAHHRQPPRPTATHPGYQRPSRTPRSPDRPRSPTTRCRARRPSRPRTDHSRQMDAPSRRRLVRLRRRTRQSPQSPDMTNTPST